MFATKTNPVSDYCIKHGIAEYQFYLLTGMPYLTFERAMKHLSGQGNHRRGPNHNTMELIYKVLNIDNPTDILANLESVNKTVLRNTADSLIVLRIYGDVDITPVVKSLSRKKVITWQMFTTEYRRCLENIELAQKQKSDEQQFLIMLSKISENGLPERVKEFLRKVVND